MTFESVDYESQAAVATIRLNRPQRLNAMNRQLIDDVRLAFRQANHDPAVRAILFCGAGRAFCAGDDRKAHQHFDDALAAADFVDSIQQVTREILFGEKLVVGAIHGWAVGGGFEWALNCDFTVWAESTEAFFPEVSLNLLVTGGITSLLPAMVGLTRAREMLLLGERYSARQLERLGVVGSVAADDEMESQALQLASRLAGLPPASSRAMKRVLNQTAMQSIESALKLETEATTAAFLDPETTRLLRDFG